MHQISEQIRKGFSYVTINAWQSALAAVLCPAKRPVRLPVERLYIFLPVTLSARSASLNGLFCVKTASFGLFGERPLIGLSLVRLWQKSRGAAPKKNNAHG
jgi:hypothetical protein